MVFEQPIKRMKVDALLPTILGEGTCIAWELDDKFCSRRLEFAVLFGRSPTDEYESLGVTRDTFYIDPVQRRTGVDLEAYYAVVVRDRDTNERWNGPPQRTGSNWSKYHWRIAREIVRQEDVRLKKGAVPGIRGWLLKRKNYGEPCAACTNPVTGKVERPECVECYGTGIEGGYYPAVEAWVDMNPDIVIRKLTADEGMIKDKVTNFRVLAYPRFEANDFWVDAGQNLRYRVQEKVQTVGHVSGVPIVQQVDVKLEELTNVIYQFPVNDDV